MTMTDLSHLKSLVKAANERRQVDPGSKTARIPNYVPKQHSTIPRLGRVNIPPSFVFFYACKVLNDLVLAEEETIWDLYGDIIAAWRGPTAGKGTLKNLSELWQDETDWVSAFRKERDSEELATVVTKIKFALANTELSYVPAIFLEDFAAETSAEVPELIDSIAAHFRSETSKNSIYLLPFLLKIELNLVNGDLSREQPRSEAEDVLIIATAKAIVHESRHLVGTLLHGVTYRSPAIRQGLFTDSPEELDEATTQGEAGEWFEASRYGASIQPSLLSPSEEGPLSTARLAIIGHIDGAAATRSLQPSMVTEIANTVRAGTFFQASLFFGVEQTRVLENTYVLYLPQLEPTSFYPTLSSPSSIWRHCRASPRQTNASENSLVKSPKEVLAAPSHRLRGLYQNYPGVVRDLTPVVDVTGKMAGLGLAPSSTLSSKNM
ncbi:hypothetical protein K438DRAFT_1964658 [Mycena galopus ATCC 62051]|nr:hypothetical protein K438DRAFT_1964658 [Mycena galopus ATCC 62051]